MDGDDGDQQAIWKITFQVNFLVYAFLQGNWSFYVILQMEMMPPIICLKCYIFL